MMCSAGFVGFPLLQMSCRLADDVVTRLGICLVFTVDNGKERFA